jgi:hypothetical protein
MNVLQEKMNSLTERSEYNFQLLVAVKMQICLSFVKRLSDLPGW